ncbi:hypothetical protein VNI00_016414 [Paramarasmius palmivorus]|uniref:CxC2-like cysteine cluster KDZ transposase-associated domain-containing protein n=1 Tax=Paramarasmius palmivorus TaxID=297713 RepID=A0AAW0BEF9_9AGAR
MSKKRGRVDSGIPEISFSCKDENLLRIASVSTDRRRVRQRTIPFSPIPPSPVKSTTSAQLNNFVATTDFYGVNELEEDIREEDSGPQRSDTADNPLKDFVPRTMDYLLEMLRLEGHGSEERPCLCGAAEGVLYRCRDCSEGRVLCKSCTVSQHKSRPFHYIERWNGSFFERVTLKTLGLRIQLGHPSGHICSMPRQARAGFVVVDIDSTQEVDVYFCMCQHPDVVGEQWQQLMRFELFPATSIQPHTAFTFRLLRFFHTLTLQGKINIYDYYISIQNRTDGAGITAFKDRYEAFRRVMRQWRYLKLLKRAGVSNTPSRSLLDIKRGGLAPRCLACPIPGVNLPDDWMLIEPAKSYIYRKFISVDACFRLKRRLISSEKLDPGLATGLAYFVPQDEYHRFQKSTGEQKEDESCTGSDLAAIRQANTKFNKGYATTGVVLCVCARHEVVEPNSAVDLDKGEKYALTDYSVSASQSLSDNRLPRVLSYDIACQYHKKFFDRIPNLPESVRMETDSKKWTFAVPKLHIRGHGIQCQQSFSLHLTPGVGQCDCEGIERHWGDEGPIATSTREMGPGHRRDTIDDHFCSWSHRKRIGLGRLLAKRRKDAKKQAKIHADEFVKMCKFQGANVEEWTKMVTDWENGLTDENPYVKPDIGFTEDDVRYQFAQEEAEQARTGHPSVHDVSPSAFMYMALDLEEEQRVLTLDLANDGATTVLQKTEILTRRARIQRAIGRLRTIQKIYTPLALTASIPTNHDSTDIVEAERIDLMLPSGLPQALRSQPEMKTWVAMETKYRGGQLVSSAHEIRARLLVRRGLHQKRALDTRGQKDSRKARDTLAKNDQQMAQATAKFRAAWAAAKALHGGREDMVGYPYLKDSDIRMPEDPDLATTSNLRRMKGAKFQEQEKLLVPGESRKTTSWLWSSFDCSDASKAIYEATRLEWMKARARDLRWKEEVLLLEEEMRRVLVTLEYEAKEWLARVATEDLTGPLGEGVTAYALRQAAIRRGLAAKFRSMWEDDKPDKSHAMDGPPRSLGVDGDSDNDSDNE